MNEQWNNSLLAFESKAQADQATFIDLSGFYTWEIRNKTPPPMGAAMVFQVYFEDPSVHPDTPSFDLVVSDPTMFGFQDGSLLLSSQGGSSFISGIAHVWIMPIGAEATLTAWGTRRS